MKHYTPRPSGRPGGVAKDSTCSQSSALARHCQPVALAIHKRGRWCTVAKLTTFLCSDEPILAVAWLQQRGTTRAISLPEVVLDLAERCGATRFYLQDRRRRRMWSLPLTTFRRGRLGADGERYVLLSWLRPVPFREWRFAERTVLLAARSRPAPPAVQLALPLLEEGNR